MKSVNLLSRILKAALLLVFSVTLSFGQNELFLVKKRGVKKRVYKCHEIGKQKHHVKKFSKREAKKIVAVNIKNEKRTLENNFFFQDSVKSYSENKVVLFASAFQAEVNKVEAELEEENNMPLPQPVYFRFDTDELTYDDIHQIILAIELVKQGRSIILEGHTDSHGSNEYNLALSMKRAHKIRKMMMDLGNIDGNAIAVRYFGEEKPAVENDTHENRQLNRRVEFIVLN